ncbi:unnamed protein product [Vitrella brassicaformis CCMP3155]|uniref:Uncharacterized protein n=1 Tax=Vitrella brassicaformis (strain CCMP3155) TaxID=1169540 RepID=A0A0G4EJ87_VITBC|nr:unnamed protein product [Vitrella brassicaformis CCMP3155]|eukprot:CEL95975.1 unnamed protein product [Vitrella brassicaformis CCMP3155]
MALYLKNLHEFVSSLEVFTESSVPKLSFNQLVGGFPKPSEVPRGVVCAVLCTKDSNKIIERIHELQPRWFERSWSSEGRHERSVPAVEGRFISEAGLSRERFDLM